MLRLRPKTFFSASSRLNNHFLRFFSVENRGGHVCGLSACSWSGSCGVTFRGAVHVLMVSVSPLIKVRRSEIMGISGEERGWLCVDMWWCRILCQEDSLKSCGYHREKWWMNEGTRMGNGRNYYLKEEVNHVYKKVYGRYTTEHRHREINETARITTKWLGVIGRRDLKKERIISKHP